MFHSLKFSEAEKGTTLHRCILNLFWFAIVGSESGKASCSVAEYVPGPGMEKLQETSSELASAMQKNKMVRK